MNQSIVRVLFAMLALVVATGASANDAPVGRCREFNWKPGDVIPVESAMYRHVSIKLPEDSLDVVWGAKSLWEIGFVKQYIFAKALTAEPQGAMTTVTVVGQSGNSYEFELRRVSQPKHQCVIVSTNGGLVNKAAWGQMDAQQGAKVQALTNEIAKLNAEKAELARDGDRKAREAIRLYSGSIYTNYEWTQATGWFAGGGDIVESVHDDGRFTFVRLKSDNRGLMTIQAEIDGKKEILESTYDATSRTHKISGIFPKFVMRAGNSELTILRKGA